MRLDLEIVVNNRRVLYATVRNPPWTVTVSRAWPFSSITPRLYHLLDMPAVSGEMYAIRDFTTLTRKCSSTDCPFEIVVGLVGDDVRGVLLVMDPSGPFSGLGAKVSLDLFQAFIFRVRRGPSLRESLVIDDATLLSNSHKEVKPS
jgi:hypothetical protein